MARPRHQTGPRSLDDCFAHGRRDRMRVAEALALLAGHTEPVVGVEEAPLTGALGRVLAETLIGERDVPGFDNAAVDGYAFAHADLAPEGETRLRVEGRAAAGHPLAAPLRPGHAARVLTGAMMPPGADTALMQEDVRVEGEWVVIPPGVKPGANRRRAGEDIRKGAAVLEAGLRLRPQEIGVAASLGRPTLRVFQRLRVALFSSGDELREPGEALAPGATYDSNRFLLHALLQGVGAEITDFGVLPDRAEAVRAALVEATEEYDAIVTSGGASRGDEDHVVAMASALGRLHFWQIAMKPGRPLALGRLGERGAVFVGLPGNPVAAMVCFLRFARPVLLRLGGARWTEPARYRVPADFEFTKKPDRLELLRAALVRGEGGELRVRKVAREGSGVLTSLTEADGLVEVAEDVTAIHPGDPVDFMPFSELGVAA